MHNQSIIPVLVACFLSFSVVTFNTLAHTPPPESNSPYALSLLAGLESYPDSEHSSMSRGVGLSFIRDDLKYDHKMELDKDYLQMRFTYYYERDSEKYDVDRFRNSADAKLHYSKPFTQLGDESQYLLSLHGRYEGHYNSQQLEEFEQLAVAGLRVDRRFINTNQYDFSLTLGIGYSEEEKDDDWPKDEMGLDTDTLHRSGFGYLVEFDNRYTFSHSGVQLEVKLSRFDGRWAYSDNQYYVVNKLEFNVITPLDDQNNLLHLTSQYIRRDYEIDLLGFEDTLFRVGIEYIHYF